MKIKKGDEIKVVKGKDKGKSGKIERVFSKENKLLILGINQYKRHMKAKTQTQKSEIITIAKPLPIANIMLICPKCHLETKVEYSLKGDEKERICKKCRQVI